MTAPKNWLSPGARQELQRQLDNFNKKEWGSGQVFAQTCQEAVPQLLDEVERLQQHVLESLNLKVERERGALKAEVERLRKLVEDYDLRPDE